MSFSANSSAITAQDQQVKTVLLGQKQPTRLHNRHGDLLRAEPPKGIARSKAAPRTRLFFGFHDFPWFSGSFMSSRHRMNRTDLSYVRVETYSHTRTAYSRFLSADSLPQYANLPTWPNIGHDAALFTFQRQLGVYPRIKRPGLLIPLVDLYLYSPCSFLPDATVWLIVLWYPATVQTLYPFGQDVSIYLM